MLRRDGEQGVGEPPLVTGTKPPALLRWTAGIGEHMSVAIGCKELEVHRPRLDHA